MLLADGFFTFFTNLKKRAINVKVSRSSPDWRRPRERDDKLFAITHTTIPTGAYPSVQECVAKLLEMIADDQEACDDGGPAQHAPDLRRRRG